MGKTAFQANAFQKNAFQIFGDTSDGFARSKPLDRKKIKRKASMLLHEYQAIIGNPLDNARNVISAVDPFVKPETEEEQKKRDSAQYIIDSPPSVERIDFQALYENVISRSRLIEAIAIAKEKKLLQIKRQREEDESFVMLLLGLSY
jgi:hypothetical protein